jgi:hypothetical protein
MESAYSVCMASLEDRIVLCGPSPSEAAAIAEYEHISKDTAVTPDLYLLCREHGPGTIEQMIIDDIRSAPLARNAAHAAGLLSAVQRLLSEHERDSQGRKGYNHD